MRTYREQLTELGIDNVSGIVYNADELMESQRSRQAYYGCTPKPHSHPTVTNVVQNWLLGNLLPFTQRVRKRTCVKAIVYAVFTLACVKVF